MSVEHQIYALFLFFFVWNIGWHAWMRTRIPAEKAKLVRAGQLSGLLGLAAAAVMVIVTRVVTPFPFLILFPIYLMLYYYLGFVVFALPNSKQ